MVWYTRNKWGRIITIASYWNSILLSPSDINSTTHTSPHLSPREVDHHTPTTTINPSPLRSRVGLVLECPGTTAFSLRTTLQLITAPIQSLSVYDFDRSVTTLTPDMLSGAKLHIRHLQFSQSHLELVADNALRTVSNSLESLSIVNGKLKRVS